MDASISLLSMVPTASMEARGCGIIRVALGAPWFCSFFLDFRRYDSVGEFDSPGVKTHRQPPSTDRQPAVPAASYVVVKVLFFLLPITR